MKTENLLTITILLFAISLLLPLAAHAEDSLLEEKPHWSLELKGGVFYPDIDDWGKYYGKDYTYHFAGAIAYKIVRQLEIGIEGAYIKDQGQGYAPIHDIFTGNVTYELFPLHLFVLFRAVLNEEQWLVPYVGGGWTRMYYRQEVELQGTARGSTDGYHLRGGLQFLLDGLDRGSSSNLYGDYGISHTYFFLEAQYIDAEIDTSSGSYNLGGISYLLGLLFEF